MFLFDFGDLVESKIQNYNQETMSKRGPRMRVLARDKEKSTNADTSSTSETPKVTPARRREQPTVIARAPRAAGILFFVFRFSFRFCFYF